MDEYEKYRLHRNAFIAAITPCRTTEEREFYASHFDLMLESYIKANFKKLASGIEAMSDGSCIPPLNTPSR